MLAHVQPYRGLLLGAQIKEHLALDREAICDRTSMVDADGVVLTIKERAVRLRLTPA